MDEVIVYGGAVVMSAASKRSLMFDSGNLVRFHRGAAALFPSRYSHAQLLEIPGDPCGQFHRFFVQSL